MSDEPPRTLTRVHVLFTAIHGKLNRKMRPVAPGAQETAMDQLETAIVLTTWPVEQDPGAMAVALVEERLAACVNLLPPMESVYRWQGTVERAAERQVVIKTTRQAVERLLARLASLHPYEVPEMLVLPVSGGGEAYLRWIAENTQPRP
jgi:periplasmic divalent cation tolerance protein